jgi:hypothetical protein
MLLKPATAGFLRSSNRRSRGVRAAVETTCEHPVSQVYGSTLLGACTKVPSSGAREQHEVPDTVDAVSESNGGRQLELNDERWARGEQPTSAAVKQDAQPATAVGQKCRRGTLRGADAAVRSSSDENVFGVSPPEHSSAAARSCCFRSTFFVAITQASRRSGRIAQIDGSSVVPGAVRCSPSGPRRRRAAKRCHVTDAGRRG